MEQAKQKLAVIGSGIAGLSAAYLLRNHYAITVFEQDNRLGGHSNTIEVNGQRFDTGFMVFNKKTYPHLTQLFDHLNVETHPTEMTFSVQNLNSGLEWCGSGLDGLFSQRRNLIRPEYYRFILEIHRFNTLAPKLIEQADTGALDECSLQDFQQRYHFTERFMTDYLIPMSGAVWSTPYHKMLHFPAITLLRFFKNHGLLGLNTHFQWYTVKGGSQNYVKKMAQALAAHQFIHDPVMNIERSSKERVFVKTRAGHQESFEKVIVATHANQALKLLGAPTPLEERLLKAFNYERNIATVHSDARIMPKIRKNWSAWNFRYEKGEAMESSTIYYMNALQGLKTQTPYFVSINDRNQIKPELIHKVIDYQHPLFDTNAIKAQQELHQLNLTGPVYYVGSYHRYGFHEDALWSSVRLARFLTDNRSFMELL